MSKTNVTSPRALQSRARQDRALGLRRDGLSWAAIAKEMRYSGAGTAYKAAMTALNRQPAEDAKAVRLLELARLDELLVVARAQVAMDHVMVSDGRVVVDDKGVAVVDHAGKLAGLDRVLKIMDRRARYLGLDAPTRRIVEVYTEDHLDAEIRRLEAELALAPRDAP